jgi:phosphatidylserine/phosphatidylglycerophosphate/cardiolipin synthase-like enzyme
MIGLFSQAERVLRFAAPYIDQPGIGFLTDAIVAATRRGVSVELFEPRPWQPGHGATSALSDAVLSAGEPARFRLVGTVADAPFAHLKVMVADGTIAYIGSANITAAGLAGRNLELGVLVRGAQVAVIDRVLDLYREAPTR